MGNLDRQKGQKKVENPEENHLARAFYESAAKPVMPTLPPMSKSAPNPCKKSDLGNPET